MSTDEDPTSTPRNSRRELALPLIVGMLLIFLLGVCFWVYLLQFEFTDGYYANIQLIHGIDDRFPEVVTGPDIFARWKSDGYMEHIVAWGRSDEARLKRFANQYDWQVVEVEGTIGNSKLSLVPETVRGPIEFEKTDLWLVGSVPLRMTKAGITIFYSRKTGFALVEIKR